MEPLEDLLNEKWDDEEGADEGRIKPVVSKSDTDTGSLGSSSTTPKVHLSERLEVVYSRSLGDFESLNVEATASFDKHSDEESTLVSHDSSSELSLGSNTLDSATIATILSGDAKLVRMEDDMMKILNKMQCAQIDTVTDKVVDLEVGLKKKMAIVEKSLREKNRKMARLGCTANTDAILMDLASHEEVSSSEGDSDTLNTTGSATLGTAASNSMDTSGDDSAEAEVEALVEELEVNKASPRKPGNDEDSASPRRSKGSQWFRKLAARAPTPPLSKTKSGPDTKDKDREVASVSTPTTPVRSGSSASTISSPPRLKESPRDTSAGKKRVPPKSSSPVKDAAVVDKKSSDMPASVPDLLSKETGPMPALQPKADKASIKEVESIASGELETIEELDDLVEEMEAELEPRVMETDAKSSITTTERSPSLSSTRTSSSAKGTDNTNNPEPTPVPGPANKEDDKEIYHEPVVATKGLVPSPVNNEIAPTASPTQSQVNGEADFESEINAAIVASESALGALLAVDSSIPDTPKNDTSVASKESHDDGTILSSIEYPLGYFNASMMEEDEELTQVLLTLSEEADNGVPQKELSTGAKEPLPADLLEKTNETHEDEDLPSSPPIVSPTKIIITRKRTSHDAGLEVRPEPKESDPADVVAPPVASGDVGTEASGDILKSEAILCEDDAEDTAGIEYTLSDLEEIAAATKVAAPAATSVAANSPTSSVITTEKHAEPEARTDNPEDTSKDSHGDSTADMAPIVMISRISLSDDESEKMETTNKKATETIPPPALRASVSEEPATDDIEEVSGIEYPLGFIENEPHEESSVRTPDAEEGSASPDEASVNEGFEYTLESCEKERTMEVAAESEKAMEYVQEGEGGIEYTLDSIEQFVEKVEADNEDQPIAEDESVALQSITSASESKNKSPNRKLSLWKKRSKKKGLHGSKPGEVEESKDLAEQDAVDGDKEDLEEIDDEDQSNTLLEDSGSGAVQSSRKANGAKSPKRISALWKKRQKKEKMDSRVEPAVEETDETPSSKKAIIEIEAQPVESKSTPPETPGASADEAEKAVPESPASVIDIILGMSEMELLAASSFQDASIITGEDKQESDEPIPHPDAPTGNVDGKDEGPSSLTDNVEHPSTAAKKSKSVLAMTPKRIVPPFMRRSRSSDKDTASQTQDIEQLALTQDSDVEGISNSGGQPVVPTDSGMALQDQAVPESSMYEFMNSPSSSMMDVILGQSKEGVTPTNPDIPVTPVKISVLDQSEDNGLESKPTKETEETPRVSDVPAVGHTVDATTSGPAPWIMSPNEDTETETASSKDYAETETENANNDEIDSETEPKSPKRKRSFWKRKSVTKSNVVEATPEDDADETPIEEKKAETEEMPGACDDADANQVKDAPADGPAPWIVQLSQSDDDMQTETAKHSEIDLESEPTSPKRKRSFWKRKSATKSSVVETMPEDDADEKPIEESETEETAAARDDSATNQVNDAPTSGPAPWIIQLSPSDDDMQPETVNHGEGDAESERKSPKRKRSFWKRKSATKSNVVKAMLEDDEDETPTEEAGAEETPGVPDDSAADEVIDAPASDGPAPWIQTVSPNGNDDTEAETGNRGEHGDSAPKSPKRKQSFWTFVSTTTKSNVVETKIDDESVEEKFVEKKNLLDTKERGSDDVANDQEPYTGTAPWELMATEAAEAAIAATSWATSALGGTDDDDGASPVQQSRAPGADVEADVEQYKETPKGGLRRRIRSLGRSGSSSSLAKLGSHDDDDDVSLGEKLAKVSRRSLIRSLGSNLSSTTSSREMTRTTGSSATQKTDNRGFGSKLFSIRRSRSKSDAPSEDDGMEPLLPEEEDALEAVKLTRRRTKIKLRRKKYTDLADDASANKDERKDIQEDKTRVVTPTACYDCSSCLVNSTASNS